MQSVDLNCDMGESSSLFDYDILTDFELLRYVSSVNIACGAYAGDPQTMQRLVHAAVEKNLAIGAHPGFEDRENFGRKNIDLTAQQLYNLVLYQLGALEAFLRPYNQRLHHVKPHGALYNMAARDPALADALCAACRDFDHQLFLYGLAGSELISSAGRHGLRAAHEVFADRTYQEDGSLTPRSEPDALITNPPLAAKTVLLMVRDQQIVAANGTTIAARPDTICLHGDGPNALAFAQAIREKLEEEHIRIAPPLL